eukprot:TRINITY_DN22413_c0_g1_i1.p1 TRINITY_DN22413_c0_g1~~TRINITY_DN22413_c0_g1_i1.p1  ORF type:complete len:291 (-),score=40.50 TRINITY_DN22413_c0_g1_i1:77-877(-)
MAIIETQVASASHRDDSEICEAEVACKQENKPRAISRFQGTTALKCWQSYLKFLKEPGVKCCRCWRMTKYCCCASLPQLKLRPEVMVVFHHEELGQHTATNTANLLVCLGAELFCCGLPEHDHRLQRRLAEDGQGTVILFPSVDAVQASSLALASDAAVAGTSAKDPQALPRRIVVLDGGWSQCKKMNEWLDPAICRCVVRTASREEFGGTRRYRDENGQGRVQTAAAFVALMRELGEEPEHVHALSAGLVAFMASFEAQMGRSRT